MKKIIIPIICLAIIIIPTKISATTLKEYEDAVAKYTKELQAKEAKIAKSKEEVAQVKKNIASIEGQITKTQNEIKALEAEIIESNKQIENKSAESKKIMEYYQIENGDNAYLEYAFGAETITDMIYRLSIVEQLTSYNDKIMKELKQLIEENKKKKQSLTTKKEELSTLKKKLESEKERIETEIKDTEGIIPSVKGQIELYKSRVTYYKNKGCKSNDVIGVTCDRPANTSSSSQISAGSVISKKGFRFPTAGGGLSRGYYPGHSGLDITGYLGKPIYAAAAGRVYYIGNTLDNYHAKMVLIVHNVDGKLVFTQYAHLQGYNVSVGQDVNTNTIIGTMGNSGYVLPAPSPSCPACGTHLHFEMSEDYGWGYNAPSYSVYKSHVVNPYKYLP